MENLNLALSSESELLAFENKMRSYSDGENHFLLLSKALNSSNSPMPSILLVSWALNIIRKKTLDYRLVYTSCCILYKVFMFLDCRPKQSFSEILWGMYESNVYPDSFCSPRLNVKHMMLMLSQSLSEKASQGCSFCEDFEILDKYKDIMH
ncbi:hypothetical protein A2996_01615 [Candidatus Campbellbacteria bacterium RIFCSPLOWO2_01_FULL_34_15]|uniref:Uncharacterized protein n=2 Tax=Candidatus Campbelliibacteriota TaxID=1752727 RepID=A0A1F5EM42_9BACT|nr:MAG: hypothetical protein A2996_01615 [Candidatus Campbellbacteria bacterium RIFCSPLOWO2_01_FULL_34_15]OGD69481.1 MAG: hypothetical protein A2811_01675 [Candidatus Campbellbacteria bacterium RIFCSPHIGHO2_01_FULL_34_10]